MPLESERQTRPVRPKSHSSGPFCGSPTSEAQGRMKVLHVGPTHVRLT